jgi:uncharacterized coiled-coil DUF342 family protein
MKLKRLVRENTPELNSLFKQKTSLEAQIKKMEDKLGEVRAEYKKTLEKIINIYGRE